MALELPPFVTKDSDRDYESGPLKDLNFFKISKREVQRKKTVVLVRDWQRISVP